MQVALFESASDKMPSVKRCPKCQVLKNASAYASRGSGPWRPCSYCRECQRAYCRAHYLKNKAKHNLRRRLHQVEYIDRNRCRLAAYLSARACIDCGNFNPTVLEFDHVRGTKQLEVSTMAQAGYSWKRILEEIAKCDIRCANCHRIKTSAQFGWKGWLRVDRESTSIGR